MTPDEIIRALPFVPYMPGGRDLTGMDCWGLVEFWHANVHRIDVRDRKDHEASPAGFCDGYEGRSDWVSIDIPKNGSVAAMKAAHGRRILKAGHCGVYWQGQVLQMTETGFVAPRLNDLEVRGKITGWFKHKSL